MSDAKPVAVSNTNNSVQNHSKVSPIKLQHSESALATNTHQPDVPYDTRRVPSQLIESNSKNIVLDIDGIEFVIAGKMLEQIKETIHEEGK